MASNSFKGVGKTTTESTTKSNVTVSGDLIEYDALGGLERSVSREQGSLLQTIGKLENHVCSWVNNHISDLTDLGPDDALFYDDIQEPADGIMSRMDHQQAATVIGTESLVSGLLFSASPPLKAIWNQQWIENLIDRYSKFSDLDFSDVQLATQQVGEIDLSAWAAGFFPYEHLL